MIEICFWLKLALVFLVALLGMMISYDLYHGRL